MGDITTTWMKMYYNKKYWKETNFRIYMAENGNVMRIIIIYSFLFNNIMATLHLTRRFVPWSSFLEIPHESE